LIWFAEADRPRRQRLLVVLLTLVSSLGSVETSTPGEQAPRGKPVRRAAKPIPHQYIVTLLPDEDGEAVSRDVARQHAGRVKHVYRRAATGFAVRLSAAAAERLAEDPRVLAVEEDGVLELAQAATTWGLDRIDQRLLPLDQIFSVAGTGAGVAVHVLDTGIRVSHAEFGGRAHIGGDYVDDDEDGDSDDVGNDDGNPAEPDGLDCHGHGTHVAGTIGGATYGVAPNVTLYAHRVLGCDGTGTISSIIAAIDAVTSHPHRPAIINMSLGSGVSDAFDVAVMNSIAAGVTHVVAAGNNNNDADTVSPARVSEAVTVGATDAADTRAPFSNYGPSVDLFAPGVGVDSAWFTSDAAVRQLSGTSMAAPHVAGTAAIYLEQNPTHTPEQVRNALVAAATLNVVSSAGVGSANRLLFAGTAIVPAMTLESPNGGERAFAGTPYLVQWSASLDAFTRFDLEVSTDAGKTYSPATGCSAVGGDERSCMWIPPAVATGKALVRLTGTALYGAAARDQSNAVFSVVLGSPSLKVTTPTTSLKWPHGSRQEIKWSHNLGANSFVRLELSRDGGVTFPELIVSAVKNSGSSGSYIWRVTGPPVESAVVRVSWMRGPVSDVSDIAFRITDAFLSLTVPNSSATNWGFGTLQRVKWSTNLGRFDTVQVLLSADGGLSFPIVLATTAASAQSAQITVPTLPADSPAQLRIAWLDGPDVGGGAAVSPIFLIAAPYVRVLAPNGGDTWTAGGTSTVKWQSNLGALEGVRLELSTDAGATWTTLVGSTPSDGSHKLLVSSAWASTSASLRIVWAQDGAVADYSNAVFRIR
jgi:subtilisin family serine protease